MSIQPVPPSTGPTTAGQLAARATQNDQALAAWLDDHEGRVAALESGSGTSGMAGRYLSDGQWIDFVYVASDTDPGTTMTIEGKTYEVWWVQTAPPDPMQSIPAQVTQDLATRSYTVPTDPAATYTIDGVTKAAGTYGIGTIEAKTIQWAAVAKSGYGFKAGAVTSGSLVYPAKTYGAGDVVLSDSFDSRTGAVAGSATDSFAGGEPITWAVWSDAGATAQIVDGAMVAVRADTRVSVFSMNDLVLPQAFDRVDIVWTAKDVGTSEQMPATFSLLDASGTIIISTNVAGGYTAYPGQGIVNTPAGTVQGDTLRLEWRTGQHPAVHNETRGTQGPLIGTGIATQTAAVKRVRVDMRPTNSTAVGTANKNGLDSIKVTVR